MSKRHKNKLPLPDCSEFVHEWVGICCNKIIAHAKTIDGVLKLAKESGHPDPVLWKVPDPKFLWFFYARV